MSLPVSGPVPTEELIELLAPQLRRVARLVTGSREGAEDVTRRVVAELRRGEDRAYADDFATLTWTVCARILTTAPAVTPNDMGPLTPDSTPTDHLARALASLPVRKRIAIALSSQAQLTPKQLGTALGVGPDQATALVSASQAHMEAIVRAMGDSIRA